MAVSGKASVLSRTDAKPPQARNFDPLASDDAAQKVAAFRKARRHSSRVSILKIVLPIVAIMTGAAFFGYSYAVTPAKLSLDVSDSAVSDGKLVMSNPKLEGFTQLNKPYSMTAFRAYQNLTNPGLIELEQVDAKLPYDEKNVASIKAESGFYDQQANTLKLDKGLTVTTTDGISVKLNSAYIDISKGEITTDLPVDIHLKGSRIQAESMSIQDQGQKMVFDKRVRMVVEPGNASPQKAGGS